MDDAERRGPLLANQRGATMFELLAFVAVATVASLAGLRQTYFSHQLNSAVSEVQGQIHRGRVAAMKEKTDHRVTFHDLTALSPNAVELSWDVGGKFWSLDGAVTLPATVAVLGTSPYDSLASTTVTRRGWCTSGNLFLASANDVVVRVEIGPTCSMTATRVSP